MSFSKVLYITLLFSFIFRQSVAQDRNQVASYDKEIDILNTDIKLLEQYLKLYTDSVRLAHGLNTQKYENTLYLAADNHAKYLLKNKLLSHYQSDQKDKRAPQNRVEFFGGEFSYLSENLAQVSLINSLKNSAITGSNFERILWSYARSAQFIVEVWVNSPGHYLNLINNSSTHTAIAIQIDETEGALYAVQLFSKPSKDFTTDAEFFPYQDLVLAPIAYNFLPSAKISKRLDKYGSYTRKIEMSGGVLSTNYSTARKLFKWNKRNSGLIMEGENDALFYKELSAVLSGKTRANGLDYFNIKALNVIDRRALFKEAKTHLNPKKDYVKVLGIRLPIVKNRAKFQYFLPHFNYSDIF